MKDKYLGKYIEPGIYSIQSGINGGKVLEIPDYSLSEYDSLQIWDDMGYRNQKFVIKEAGVNKPVRTYTIKSLYSGKTLTASKDDIAIGHKVQQKDYEGSSVQEWEIYDAGDGYCYICRDGLIALALDIDCGNTSNGTSIQTWPLNYSDAQKFKLVRDRMQI